MPHIWWGRRRRVAVQCFNRRSRSASRKSLWCSQLRMAITLGVRLIGVLPRARLRKSCVAGRGSAIGIPGRSRHERILALGMRPAQPPADALISPMLVIDDWLSWDDRKHSLDEGRAMARISHPNVLQVHWAMACRASIASRLGPCAAHPQRRVFGRRRPSCAQHRAPRHRAEQHPSRRKAPTPRRRPRTFRLFARAARRANTNSAARRPIWHSRSRSHARAIRPWFTRRRLLTRLRRVRALRGAPALRRRRDHRDPDAARTAPVPRPSGLRAGFPEDLDRVLRVTGGDIVASVRQALGKRWAGAWPPA